MKRKCFKCDTTYKIESFSLGVIGSLYLCSNCFADILLDNMREEENDRSLDEQSLDDDIENPFKHVDAPD